MEPEQEQLQLLRQIAKWTRELALASVAERVGPLLDTDAKKRVYEAIADGRVSVRKLEELASVSRVTAQKFVDEWEAAGLVEPGSDPPKAVFTLGELRIAPATRKAAKKPAK